MLTHLNERDTFLVQTEVSGRAWAVCASSESSLKRSLWTRSLQSALHPGLRLPPLCSLSWIHGAVCFPLPEGFAGLTKSTNDSRSGWAVMFTAARQVLWAPFFTGSTASNTCNISSSRANVDSPSGNAVPPHWEGDERGIVCLNLVSFRGHSRKRLLHSPCRCFCECSPMCLLCRHHLVGHRFENCHTQKRSVHTRCDQTRYVYICHISSP